MAFGQCCVGLLLLGCSRVTRAAGELHVHGQRADVGGGLHASLLMHVPLLGLLLAALGKRGGVGLPVRQPVGAAERACQFGLGGLQPCLVLLLLVGAGLQAEGEAVQRGLGGLSRVFGLLVVGSAGVELALRGADGRALGVPIGFLGVPPGYFCIIQPASPR